MQEPKEICLVINGEQSVKLKSGLIESKNYFKQFSVPFKIGADFECLLKKNKRNDKNNNTSYTEKVQEHIPCSFAYKNMCIDDRFSKPLFFTEEKINLLKRFLKKWNCKKNNKKAFQ